MTMMRCSIATLLFGCVVALVSAASMHNYERQYQVEPPRYSTSSSYGNSRQSRNGYTNYAVTSEYQRPRDDYYYSNDRRPQVSPPYYPQSHRPRRSLPELNQPQIHVEDYDEQPMAAPERFKRNIPEPKRPEVRLEHRPAKPILVDKRPLPAEISRFRRSAHEEEDKALHSAQQHVAVEPMYATKDERDDVRVKRSSPQSAQTLDFVYEDTEPAEDGQYETELEDHEHWDDSRSKRDIQPKKSQRPSRRPMPAVQPIKP